MSQAPPNLRADRSNVNGWFGQPGTGKQDKITQELIDPRNGNVLKPNIQNLIEQGYIREIK